MRDCWIVLSAFCPYFLNSTGGAYVPCKPNARLDRECCDRYFMFVTVTGRLAGAAGQRRSLCRQLWVPECGWFEALLHHQLAHYGVCLIRPVNMAYAVVTAQTDG